MRWECKLNVPIEHAWKMSRDPDVRVKWEKVLNGFEVLEANVDEGHEIIYYKVKTPFGIKNRDFVCIRASFEGFEGYDYVSYMT